MKMYIPPDKNNEPRCDIYMHFGGRYDTHLLLPVLMKYVIKVDRVYMYREYLTREIVEERYSNVIGYETVLFISDIRTKQDSSTEVTNEDVRRDNLTNLSLTLAMNASYSMLKFRLPYDDGYTDLPNGELRYQCWTPSYSTEVRLICSRPYSLKRYDHTDHESVMYAHNITRATTIESAPLCRTLKEELYGFNRLPHYDAYRESEVILKYCETRGSKEETVYSLIREGTNIDFEYYIGKE
jgi:hypothetical protein